MPVPPPRNPSDVTAIPWYGADRTLPASPFIPGLSLHPDRDPETGRIARGAPVIHAPWTPEQWPTLQAYLRGIDLFNRWYFWEAHEAWEPLWRAHPPQSDPARFIQGLISAAAALLKLRMGNLRSAHTLAKKAGNRFASFRGIWMGLAVEALQTDVNRYLASVDPGGSPIFGAETPLIRLDGML